MSIGVPAAIIIAGAIIAVAILITRGGVQGEAVQIIDQPYAKLAERVGVDVLEFQACMDEGRGESVVDRDSINAIDTGGTGTPWSLVVTESGSIYSIGGAQPYNVSKEIIELALADQVANKKNTPEDAALTSYRPISEDDHLYGNPDAEVTVIEYSDFECPFCKTFHPIVERLVNESDGKVNWVYRHFPLESIHPNARGMALASECVAELGGNEAFWEFSNKLFGL